MMYDYVQCPHRLTLDLFGDPSKRDPISSFVKLLWEKGINFEKEVIQQLDQPYLDLSSYLGPEREKLTKEAFDSGEDLIYGGRITVDNLIGDPDLLRRHGDGYVAGDIKSGAGLEGESELTEGKPKKHYAFQLALYTDILERLRMSSNRTPFIWDIHGQEIAYDLNASQGVRKPESLWMEYKNGLDTVSKIAKQELQTMPAYSGICKLCNWRTFCLERLKKDDDLSLISELGRSKRDTMINQIRSISEFAEADLIKFVDGKQTIFRGIGIGSLQKFQKRAMLLSKPNSKPYLKDQITLPKTDLELFFDIETDPLRDVCYLHGFIERHGFDNSTERYISFFANRPVSEDEERAFNEAWQYVKKSLPCAIYYYSPFERTHWKKLQEKYFHVMSENDIEIMFSPDYSVDLYSDVVRKKTEWPTNDYSIKTLASFLGFDWRDTSPSGAESVEWYHRWVECGDVEIKNRILEYNEDDCIATRVLLDGIRSLPLIAQ